ncbi:LLM class F420-dependent oxidoreductase [Amycolatopsis regifaucium]|uniref:LLM class F420-dependent oxidoreductase n=1 Tax=Amycolatopsis regifaucium TaxID=546365 RepID=A0A154MWZ4_9PSEU|nr:LLM class F420-dependent oxidoreductase [Amycolatopsis regifaucium]KZB87979.1 LLM class F420-dependent oxidoreductase [Amycolatopsis regifaucium]OKA04518.1 LLM class F420-dependent oxidoreductase [Amycolatopsis regifaucium]SFH51260.1 probable F420-dependent oxidoreductase, Rv3093c family [Amycolatopsis regifaucium]
MDRWGITIPLPGVPLARHREIVEELPDLGYTDLWTSEKAGTDAFTPLALASQWAPGLRLGTAVAQVYTRGPALLAMNAATLAGLAPGRFVLGIGASSPVIVRKWNATEYATPLRRVRDTLRFLRTALAGERVSEDYETFSVRDFRLEHPVDPPPELALAALRPEMLRLAAREADCAITNWLAPGDVPRIRKEVGQDIELAARVFVCPTPDKALARRLARRLITGYLTVPVYAAFHEWLGRGEALAPMHEAWSRGDRRKAMEVIPDEVVDDLVVHGGPEHCRARIQSYVDSGLSTPIIALVATGDCPMDHVRKLGPS